MESKKDRTYRLLKNNSNILICPVCGSNLRCGPDYKITCTNNHSFDISKKGVINLHGKPAGGMYDRNLFLNRKHIINDVFFTPLIEEINKLVSSLDLSSSKLRILDAGCGEGGLLDLFISGFTNTTETLFIGTDLSKDGINLATDHEGDVLWMISDIANSHLAEDSIDILINILSPANYNEFNRLLKKNGYLIKVIPGKSHLKEIRESLFEKDQYNNKDTLSLASKSISVAAHEHVQYVRSLEHEQLDSLIGMTPLSHNKIPKKNEIQNITMDFHILLGKICV